MWAAAFLRKARVLTILFDSFPLRPEMVFPTVTTFSVVTDPDTPDWLHAVLCPDSANRATLPSVTCLSLCVQHLFSHLWAYESLIACIPSAGSDPHPFAKIETLWITFGHSCKPNVDTVDMFVLIFSKAALLGLDCDTNSHTPDLERIGFEISTRHAKLQVTCRKMNWFRY